MKIALKQKTRKPTWDVCSVQLWTIDIEMPNININFFLNHFILRSGRT